MTQEELAEAADLDQTTISKYETGASNPQNRDIVIKIAEALFTATLSPGVDARSFINTALAAAGYRSEFSDDDEERTRAALLIAENYWNLRGSKKAAVDALLFSDEDGNEYSLRDIARITGQDGSADDDGTIGKRAK